MSLLLLTFLDVIGDDDEEVDVDAEDVDAGLLLLVSVFDFLPLTPLAPCTVVAVVVVVVVPDDVPVTMPNGLPIADVDADAEVGVKDVKGNTSKSSVKGGGSSRFLLLASTPIESPPMVQMKGV